MHLQATCQCHVSGLLQVHSCAASRGAAPSLFQLSQLSQLLGPNAAPCLQTPPLHGVPSVGEPDSAWPQYQQSREEERETVRLSDIYLKVILHS